MDFDKYLDDSRCEAQGDYKISCDCCGHRDWLDNFEAEEDGTLICPSCQGVAWKEHIVTDGKPLEPRNEFLDFSKL